MNKEIVNDKLNHGEAERKPATGSGLYRTPQRILDYCIANCDVEVKIVEPTQGCGAFLAQAISYLRKREGMDLVLLNPPFSTPNSHSNQPGTP